MRKYDLVVIGAGLGGLAAAALAVKSSNKVLLLAPGESAGGVLMPVKKESLLFSPGPQVSFGFDRGGVFQQLAETLGINPPASLRSPCYQVALPDHRITVFSEQSETIEELCREFPQDKDEIKNFYSSLRKQSVKNEKSRVSTFFSQAKSASSFLQSYRFSKQFRSFLDVQSFYFFRLPASAISVSALTTLYDSAPYTISFGKLSSQLVEVILKNGGEIRYGMQFTDIKVKGRTILSPSGELASDSILVNTERERRSRLLLCALKNKAVPVGMGNHVLALSDYNHPENYFTLSINSDVDQTVPSSDARALTAEFFFGLTNYEHLSHIKGLIPFFDDFNLFYQEFDPAPAVFSFPDQIKFKTITSGDRHSVLSRTSIRGVFWLPDGAGTPLQSVAAARRFMELTK